MRIIIISSILNPLIFRIVTHLKRKKVKHHPHKSNRNRMIPSPLPPSG